MKNSGCNVPEYMLTMKKASKRTRRKLEKTVPNREDIRVKAPSDVRKKKVKNVNGDVKPTQNGQTTKGKPMPKNGADKLANGKRKGPEIANAAQKKKRKNTN